jgi:GNAT superfamily N-acetyltransferase
MPQFSIRPAVPSDASAIRTLAERLPAFGPTTRSAAEIVQRERAALLDAISRPTEDSALLVAEQGSRGVVGVVLLDSRRDYFTDEVHGHVAILAVAHEVEGQGVGRALLKAADEWARGRGFARLTLAVFADNRRAKEVYARQGWRPELETWFKPLS